MSKGSNRTARARKKREQALSRLIMFVLAIIIIIPWLCCAIIFVKVQSLNHSLQETTTQLEELKNLLMEQQMEQQNILSELREAGTVQDVVSESADVFVQEVPDEDGEEIPETLERINKEAAHKVYLTFDDGPSEYTDEILDILDRYGVKATFFVIGKEDLASQELLQEIVSRGHSLGMHSFSHKYSEIYESVDVFEEDLLKIQDYLYEVTGVKSTLYRFPGGSSNQVSDVEMQQFAKCLQEHGVVFYDWNVSSGDGGSILLSVEELTDNVTKNINLWGTSIVLLHDSVDKQTTVEALPIIIENILAMEDTVILPITEETEPVQHIK